MIRDTEKWTLRSRIGAGLAAALIACSGTSVTLAQDDYPEDWEYEPGEGYHEQEWYDPSDWFDAEDGVDYEYDDMYDYDYDYDYEYDGWDDDYVYDDMYDYDYDYYDDYYAAYYDGYYDGYYDDDFGYEDDTVLVEDTTYSEGYIDGYYDGYYDQVEAYDYDPYYYVMTTTITDRDEQSDQQRAQDESRQRGDRAKGMTQGDQKQQQAETRQRAAEQHRKSAKIRGTVENISYVRGASADDDKMMIVRVKMKDGKQATLNLGPKMSKQRLPFKEGDRVTFSGTLRDMDGQRRLRTHTITTGGDTITIASRPGERRERSAQRGDRQDRRTADRDRQYENAQRARVNFSGRVADMRRMRLGSDDYLIVRIDMRDNPTRHIAISEDQFDSVEELGLSRGDRIDVRGHYKRVEDRRVVVADRLRINGEQVTLSQAR